MIFVFRKREKVKNTARVSYELSRTLACLYISIRYNTYKII
jgi:hypothetical protein